MHLLFYFRQNNGSEPAHLRFKENEVQTAETVTVEGTCCWKICSTQDNCSQLLKEGQNIKLKIEDIFKRIFELRYFLWHFLIAPFSVTVTSAPTLYDQRTETCKDESGTEKAKTNSPSGQSRSTLRICSGPPNSSQLLCRLPALLI